MKKLQDALIQIGASYKNHCEKQRLAWENGDYFNIFTILGLSKEEVRLHSAFLSELLNPKGHHGMGKRFLTEFLKEVGIEEDFINEVKQEGIAERAIGNVTDNEGGRIDIVLEDTCQNHGVIIENKIYAGDQYNQLLRYNNYAKKKFTKGYRLLYLTLDGGNPSKISTNGEHFDYKCISFKISICLNFHQKIEHCLLKKVKYEF